MTEQVDALPVVSRARYLGASILSLALISWLVVVGLLGIAHSLRQAGLAVLGPPRTVFWDDATIVLVGSYVVGSVALALLVRRVRPGFLTAALIAMLLAPLAASALTTGSLLALWPALAIGLVSWMAGDALMSRVQGGGIGWAGRLVVVIAIGNGMLGLALLGLAATGLLNTLAVVTLSAALVLGWAWARGGAALAWARKAWERAPALGRGGLSGSTVDVLLAALASALVGLALMYVFVPEQDVTIDSVAQHLPIARAIWDLGSVPTFALWFTADYPVHAHLYYALAYGLAGQSAVPVVHAAAGLWAIGGTGALAASLGGRRAGLGAAALFGTAPIVMWELGQAYVDLVPVAFVVSASLCCVAWLRTTSAAWLVAAGGTLAFAFAAKITVGTAAAAVVIATVIVGHHGARLRGRVVALAALSLGALAVVPWLARSFLLTGTIPGLGILGEAITGERGDVGYNLDRFGVGRAPFDLLRLPWEATFNGHIFADELPPLGIGFLLLLPLALAMARNRENALVALAALLAFLGWAVTAQYARYGLPMLALVSVVCALGVVGAGRLGQRPAAPRAPEYRASDADSALTVGTLRNAAPLGLVLAIALAPLAHFPSWSAQLPMGLFTGSVTRDELLRQWIQGYSVIIDARSLLPAGARVGWIGEGAGPQAYADVTLVPIWDPQDFGTTDEEVLAALGRQDLGYVVWQRPGNDVAWRSRVVSTDFLLARSRPIAAARNAYVFRIVERDGDWGAGGPNLLVDPGFVAAPGREWSMLGNPGWKAGVVELRDGAGISQSVRLRTGGPHTLLVTASCAGPKDWLTLNVRWVDAAGTSVRTDVERVLPGPVQSRQFLWSMSPDSAVGAEVRVQSDVTAICDVSRVTLTGPQ